MGNRRTTIELTPQTEPILAMLEQAGFDIRRIFNGALLAFNHLSGDEQKSHIAEAMGFDIDDPAEQAASHARMCIKLYQSLSPKNLAVSLQFLPPIESRAIQELLATLSPGDIMPSTKRQPKKA
jgi:hypothetical protein